MGLDYSTSTSCSPRLDWVGHQFIPYTHLRDDPGIQKAGEHCLRLFSTTCLCCGHRIFRTGCSRSSRQLRKPASASHKRGAPEIMSRLWLSDLPYHGPRIESSVARPGYGSGTNQQFVKCSKKTLPLKPSSLIC